MNNSSFLITFSSNLDLTFDKIQMEILGICIFNFCVLLFPFCTRHPPALALSPSTKSDPRIHIYWCCFSFNEMETYCMASS